MCGLVGASCMTSTRGRTCRKRASNSQWSIARWAPHDMLAVVGNRDVLEGDLEFHMPLAVPRPC
eukprot:3272840-Amphidinium_carterae.1